MCCVSLHDKNAQPQIHPYIDMNRRETAEYTQRGGKMKARLGVCTYATHHTQTKKLKEFSVKLWAT